MRKEFTSQAKLLYEPKNIGFQIRNVYTYVENVVELKRKA